MGEHRDWSGSGVYERAQADSEQLERLMRSILAMFSAGKLVYRDREERTASVETKSERLRRLRRAEGEVAVTPRIAVA